MDQICMHERIKKHTESCIIINEMKVIVQCSDNYVEKKVSISSVRKFYHNEVLPDQHKLLTNT